MLTPLQLQRTNGGNRHAIDGAVEHIVEAALAGWRSPRKENAAKRSSERADTPTCKHDVLRATWAERPFGGAI
jgi:hypothetical protein